MNVKIKVLFLLFFSMNVHAQQTYNFKKLQDDPEGVSENIVTLNLCHAHFSKYEELKAGAGVEVLWGISKKIQAQGNFMFYYLNINNYGGPNFEFEPGASYTLGQKMKEKDLKIILKYKESTSGEYKTTETEYIQTTGTYLSKTKVRGGLHLKKSSVNVSTDKIFKDITSYTAVGVYGGMEFTKQAALYSEIDGKKGITSGYTRYYIDGIILPVSRYGTTASTITPLKFGARAGFATYFNPNKKKHPEYGKLNPYQVFPSFYFKSEVGYRGGEGLFFNLGAGLMIFKNK